MDRYRDTAHDWSHFRFDHLRNPNMKAVLSWTEYPAADQCPTTKDVQATITLCTLCKSITFGGFDVLAARWRW